MAWSPVAARALMPFLVFVNTLPKVAVAPLFLLWLGYGIVPNILSPRSSASFPSSSTPRSGLTQVDEGAARPGPRVRGADRGRSSSRSACPTRCRTC
jgi:ABC-type nitrate/sulfonate/bicarbonate transport system permease component